ncbi:transcriptional regulator family: Fungal Specific TF [Penicillium argentinense]|uniref:Transcriptional regulator family: Fungal Specific TF n=1 Tax=Penicillium argentinense TaxID=1131581 RepID=A0A9W9KMA7_9EURO|nr:transcriptional regulator family: Fungal Specific TF [Penicillium argentinense]KAJ5110687.1 transcriptional regulator family: Fungal Specific TF [Penicillium argentinense]
MAELPFRNSVRAEEVDFPVVSNAPLQEAAQMQMPSQRALPSIRLQTSAGPRPSPLGKVAIPRGRSVAIQGRKRVSRACESCRIRKTKCSGETPQTDLSTKLQACQNLLKEAKQFVPGPTAQKIAEYLQDDDSGYMSNDVGYMSNDVSSGSSHRVKRSKDEAADGESSSTSSVGSLESLDQIEYDVNQNDQSRATGNIGKSSEITWIQRLEKAAEQHQSGPSGQFGFDSTYKDSRAREEPHPHELNYHLDDLDIGVSEPVQTYWLPPRPLADTLFDIYLRVVHPYFPIINRPLFCEQYRSFFDSYAIPGDKWLAILNMIFAIASTYVQMTELDQHGNPQDHLLYLTRARILSLNGEDLFRHPDLQQVQVEGLISFYLLSTEQIHRAWIISSLAIRSAVSLGINMKSSSRAVTDLSKETRNRVWWSLFNLENRLGLMTGRPTCVSVNMCSSPFPLPLSDEQLQAPLGIQLLTDTAFRDKRINNVMVSLHLRQPSFGRSHGKEDMDESREWLRGLPVTPELGFLYTCDLAILVQELLDHIYTVNSVHQTWTDLKARIGDLDFTNITNDDEARDEKTRMACQYYSARIMLGRPCLCKPNESLDGSDEDQKFTQLMAVSTIRAAAHMAQLISGVLSNEQSFGISPWWCCLHYVMQTAAVLILELSLNSIHMVEEKNNILRLAKGCVRWLYRTSQNSVASHRAWRLCDSSLRRLASPMGLDVSDLPSFPSRQGQNLEVDTFGTSAFGSHPELPDYVPPPDYANQPQPMSPPDARIGAGMDNPPFQSDPLTQKLLDSFLTGFESDDSQTQ